jgi:8-oxo-dGTP diphosphatase
MPTYKDIICPNCGHSLKTYNNPVPTSDVIIEYEGGVVLILRNNPPPGWALPGGFVDYGETVDAAARREAREETNLELSDLLMFSVYSDPVRDPRQHTITTVFTAKGLGVLRGATTPPRPGCSISKTCPCSPLTMERYLKTTGHGRKAATGGFRSGNDR